MSKMSIMSLHMYDKRLLFQENTSEKDRQNKKTSQKKIKEKKEKKKEK